MVWDHEIAGSNPAIQTEGRENMEIDVVFKSGEVQSLPVTTLSYRVGVLHWTYSPFTYGPQSTEKGDIRLSEVESLTVTSVF